MMILMRVIENGIGGNGKSWFWSTRFRRDYTDKINGEIKNVTNLRNELGTVKKSDLENGCGKQ